MTDEKGENKSDMTKTVMRRSDQMTANVISEVWRNMTVDGIDDSGLDTSAVIAAMDEILRKDKEAAELGKPMSREVEQLLVTQAQGLQHLFLYFTRKAIHAKYTDQLDVYARIALKAQNQCRQTLGTVAEIRSPRKATFIKNQAQNQQVNLGGTLPENSESSENEKLETLDGDRLIAATADCGY
jgi:hypothetical protein